MRYFLISFFILLLSLQSYGAETVIVIDPGHGGKDPGSTGPNGLQEKKITLSFAQKLKTVLGKRKVSNLDKSKDVSVYLTRERDKWISQEDRIDIARIVKANIFISIHADFNEDSGVKGMCLYTFSENMKEDKASRDLALRENADEDTCFTPEIAHILADITEIDDQSSSVGLAESILAVMSPDNMGSFKKVRSGQFKILRQAGVVRILIELGLLSNFEDAKKLEDPNELQELAEIVGEGIENFMKEHDFSHKIAVFR